MVYTASRLPSGSRWNHFQGASLRPTISASAFTASLSLAANGVSIVTTDGKAGKAGLTVSSMCSVCAEPATMLACVNDDNEFCTLADRNRVFAINLLALPQTDIANVFAGLTDTSEGDRFSVGNWHTLATGSPVLANALVALDCELLSATTYGTHRIYIGRVVDVSSSEQHPLVYTDRQYADVRPLD